MALLSSVRVRENPCIEAARALAPVGAFHQFRSSPCSSSSSSSPTTTTTRRGTTMLPPPPSPQAPLSSELACGSCSCSTKTEIPGRSWPSSTTTTSTTFPSAASSAPFLPKRRPGTSKFPNLALSCTNGTTIWTSPSFLVAEGGFGRAKMAQLRAFSTRRAPHLVLGLDLEAGPAEVK
eukprot:CAMPEP_0206579100 /NCGR_PEP_ID=MMETSP0325_2-20121206/32349_1 /ASSEMBLY_ACC=CAM_ASM_000347 /TAXON_ID=2866 /ORGANISM="Crypthecodinium cohnii, Strain Seligo" /LENGTH=177 /DNA_ID=CAMNT_0054084849 /DNA_START=153 /DNA_END=683 /DNA_ORIENTATION=-